MKKIALSTKSITRNLLFCMVSTIGLTGVAVGADQEIVLTDMSGLSKTYTDSKATIYFNEQLEKRSEGKVRVKMYWGGSLGGLGEALDLVSSGSADISEIVPGYFISKLPLTAMTNAVPHTFFEPKQAMYALAYMSENNKSQQDEYERNNIKPLVFRHLGNYRLACRKPVTTMADLNGLKIRAFGSYIPKMVEAIGGVPVNVISSEVYQALGRGSLDCAYASPSDLYNFKLYEVAKNIVDVPMGGIAAYHNFINLQKFNSLPEDVQKLMVEIGQETTDWWADQKEADDKRSMELMIDEGATVVHFEEPEKLDKAIPDMVDLWKKSMASQNVDGANEYADELMEYYEKHLSE